MANQYNTWVSTRPVQLPVDTYFQVGQAMEQKAEKYSQELATTFGQLGQVSPFSKNAEAVYNKAMDQLRTGISDVAKMNLGTPQAYRKFVGLTGDPNIMRPIMQVYQDRLQGDKMMKMLQEYRAKNPDNNAWPFMKMVSDLSKETGDPASFDPYRFQHVNAIPEYYDYWKSIADDVKALKEDKTSLQKIMGDKYYKYEKEGVLEERITELATQRVLSDPRALAQFKRDIQYQGYLTNPDDPTGGLKQMASSYREAIAGKMAEAVQQFEALKKKAATEKVNPATGLPFTKVSRERFVNDAKHYLDNVLGEMSKTASLSDDQLLSQTALNNFVKSFKPYANKKVTEAWMYTPLAAAKYSADRADQRVRLKAALNQQTLNNALKTNRIAGRLQQAPVSDDKKADWVKNNLANEFPGLVVDKHGHIDYSKMSGIVRAADGRWYNESDLNNGGMYPKRNATPVALTEKEYKSVLEANKEKLTAKLKDFVKSKSLDPNQYMYGGKFNADAALNDIIKFKQNSESALIDLFQFPGGTTDEMRARVKSLFNSYKIYDEFGNEVTPNTATEITTEGGNKLSLDAAFDKKKPDILGSVYHMKSKKPMFAFNIGEKTYFIEMDEDNKRALEPMRAITERAMMGNTGTVQIGSDLSVMKMGPGGNLVNVYIPGGATPQYQNEAKSLFNSTIDNISKTLQIPKIDAMQLYQKNLSGINAAISSGSQYRLDHNGKSVYVSTNAYVDMDDRGNSTYVIPSLKGFKQDNSGKVIRVDNTDIGGAVHDYMDWFSSNRNPSMQLYNLEFFSQKQLSGLLGNMAADDEDDVPIFNFFSDTFSMNPNRPLFE